MSIGLREKDLEQIDRLSDHPRLDKNERRFLDDLRAHMNAMELPLTVTQRRAVARLRGAVEARGAVRAPAAVA